MDLLLLAFVLTLLGFSGLSSSNHGNSRPDHTDGAESLQRRHEAKCDLQGIRRTAEECLTKKGPLLEPRQEPYS